MDKNDGTVRPPWAFVAAVVLAGAALTYGASVWPALLLATGFSGQAPFAVGDPAVLRPFAELLKLIVAALAGFAVTAVHRYYHRDKPIPRSLLQAQVLLCVAGALVMIIIGSSVARAFGIAGAAGIVRFRTPVKDPKDSTILFLLVALGMACGVGLIEVAALGTLFLCLLLAALDHYGEAKARLMMLSVVAQSAVFPTEHVNRVLSSYVDDFEAREIVQGSEAVIKYVVTFSGPNAPLAWLGQELMANGTAGLKSVSWTEMKKGS